METRNREPFIANLPEFFKFYGYKTIAVFMLFQYDFQQMFLNELHCFCTDLIYEIRSFLNADEISLEQMIYFQDTEDVQDKFLKYYRLLKKETLSTDKLIASDNGNLGCVINQEKLVAAVKWLFGSKEQTEFKELTSVYFANIF